LKSFKFKQILLWWWQYLSKNDFGLTTDFLAKIRGFLFFQLRFLFFWYIVLFIKKSYWLFIFYLKFNN